MNVASHQALLPRTEPSALTDDVDRPVVLDPAVHDAGSTRVIRQATCSPAVGARSCDALLFSTRPCSTHPSNAAVTAGQLLLLAMTLASTAALVWQAITPDPARFWGVTIDRLSTLLTLLVASVGLVTYRFSIRYLHGDPHQQRFLFWLAGTVVSAYLLMLSTHLLLLLAAWSLTSLGLHRLLTHYPDRPNAARCARKKFLISRLGDLALVAAIVLVWWNWGTFDLQRFIELALAAGPAGASVTGVVLLFVLAALTKSAQFPFHSWLPETLESPTPVSALMHAGVINAGGALLLRITPLLMLVPSALLVLAIVGSLTILLGTVAMWAQVKVKRTLAWSTVSQMGFMMTQLGLAAMPVAALHIVAHGLYKARSFLRSGELPGSAFAVAQPTATRAPARRVLATTAVGTLLAVPALALASVITGFSPLHSPGELALSAILALSVGQIWVALVRQANGSRPSANRVAMATAASVVVAVAAFSLYRAAGAFLAPVLGPMPADFGPAAWAAAVIAVAAVAALVVLHAVLPAVAASPGGRAFRVHALHGFYFGALADRAVALVFSHIPSTSEHRKNNAHA